VFIGDLPSRPIEKAMAAEGLLAQIVIENMLTNFPCIAKYNALKDPVLN